MPTIREIRHRSGHNCPEAHMIDFTVTTALNSSPREVFAYITDPDLLPSWQTNTTSSVLEGTRTLAVGARLREVIERQAARRSSRSSRYLSMNRTECSDCG
jgi:uncharacterized protein YndB with AHSA1/START domain